MGRSPHRSSRRESPRRRDRDRDRDSHRDRSRERKKSSKSKDNYDNIAKMKEKMRSDLDTARSYQPEESSATSSSRSFRTEDLSAAERTSRVRAIEQIEDSGFRPASFKSSAGGAGGRVYNEQDKVSTAEKSHETAIFGPTWQSNEQRKQIEKKEKESIQAVPLPEKPKRLGTSSCMVPFEMMSENAEARQENWLKKWREQRNQLSGY